MGFFSWTCAKTHLPIMNCTSCADTDMFTVVVLRPGKYPYMGSYDGYGRVLSTEGQPISDPSEDEMLQLDWEAVERGDVKIILAKYYAGDRFEDLGKNGDELGQGHFHNQKDVENLYAHGPLSSHEAYLNWWYACGI